MKRKPKYLEAEHGQRERWLISYTDIVTLLLILFVAMAAQSVGKPPAQPVRREPQQAPKPSRATLVRAEQRLKERGLDPRLDPRGLVISLPTAILFESGDDHINPSALPVISRIAEVLRDSGNKVELAGHADAVPIHNRRFKNNWELSAARGLSLLALLTSQYGIPEARLSVSSFGAYSPKGSNDTEDGRAENRRVEILILDEPAL
ncbi:MAG: OmpA family protein [Acidobacteriia bacterium]|nr:OmpA family protein [Terriglobia bacterium]